MDDSLNLSMAQEELMGHVVVVGGTNGGGPHGRRSQSFYGSGRGEQVGQSHTQVYISHLNFRQVSELLIPSIQQ